MPETVAPVTGKAVEYVLRVPPVFMDQAFRKKILEVGKFPPPEYTFMKMGKKGIEAVVVVKQLDLKALLFPTKKNLEHFEPHLRSATLIQVGFRQGDPNVDILFMKTKGNHDLRTHGRASEDIERLARTLPKRTTQEQIIYDIDGCGFLVSSYKIPTDSFLQKGFKEDFKFA